MQLTNNIMQSTVEQPQELLFVSSSVSIVFDCEFRNQQTSAKRKGPTT